MSAHQKTRKSGMRGMQKATGKRINRLEEHRQGLLHSTQDEGAAADSVGPSDRITRVSVAVIGRVQPICPAHAQWLAQAGRWQAGRPLPLAAAYSAQAGMRTGRPVRRATAQNRE